MLANLSSALNAPVLADRQWAQAARLAERRGDHAGLIDLLGGNAQTALALGDYARCSGLATRLLALAGEHHAPIDEAIAENALGVVARRRGDLDQALRRQQRALSLHRASGGAGIGPVLGDLGTIYRDRGNFALAFEAQLDAIAWRERNDEQPEIGYRNVALLNREIEACPPRATISSAQWMAPRAAASLPSTRPWSARTRLCSTKPRVRAGERRRAGSAGDRFGARRSSAPGGWTTWRSVAPCSAAAISMRRASISRKRCSSAAASVRTRS